MADVIITRAEAMAQGLRRFFTGIPCKNGHLSVRGTSHGKCIACLNEHTRRWAETHPDRRHDQTRRAAAKHKPKQREYHKLWYVANRDKKLKKSRQYLLDNPDVNRAAALKWRNKNLDRARQYANKWHSDPENSRAHRHKRRARKLDAGGSHTSNDLRAILKSQRYLCVYCKSDLRKNKRHLDHVVPLVLGGTNGKENLQYLCAPCNLSKGAKDPIVFARELGRLL